MSERIKVTCNKCGKEHMTRLHQQGDRHKDCGGEFERQGYGGDSDVYDS